jgi:hypothetical protein
MILIPKYRDLIIPVETKTRLQGRYKIEAVGQDGRRRLLADWFPNLITNLGADQLGASFGNPVLFCSVGSGNATPLVTDTTLQSFVGSTSLTISSSRTAQPAPPYFGTLTKVFNFPAGTATGNLSEVGIGPVTSGLSLFSRALILDGSLAPTTITVLSTEALYVTYQLNQYVPTVDVTGIVNIGGINYNYTLRASNATNANNWAFFQGGDPPGISSAGIYSGVIGAITAAGPSGTSAGADSNINDAYSNGSYTLTGTSTWNIATGNFGGVTAAAVNFGTSAISRGSYQVGFGTTIPKDSSHVLTLSFRNSWLINTP